MNTTAVLPWSTAVERLPLTTLQLNLGRFCNLACLHCHVESGPRRSEMVDGDTVERFIAWIARHRPATVDLTGGAPELIPGFRRLVVQARATGCTVIDRCNLTVLDEPGQEDLAGFLAAHRVTVVASMPCYLQDNVDAQRGRGTYDRSIAGLRALNAVGYGRTPGLPLYLVYNPGGIALPPAQAALEPDYRRRLKQDWGIDFTALWCLTNVAITRWRRHLERLGQLAAYEARLEQAFNPATLPGLMCRTTLSVDWRGRLYDCDFNQAIDLPLGGNPPRHLWELAPDDLVDARVAMGRHCLACTAGAGSSCTGAVA
jgi:radical SAM/Cys-rich protein